LLRESDSGRGGAFTMDVYASSVPALEERPLQVSALLADE
jgi:hypothetical protein